MKTTDPKTWKQIDKEAEDKALRHIFNVMGFDIGICTWGEGDRHDHALKYKITIFNNKIRNRGDDIPSSFVAEGPYLETLARTIDYLKIELAGADHPIAGDHKDFADGYRAALILLSAGIDPAKLEPKP